MARRIEKELQEFRLNPPTYYSCAPIKDDIFRWQAPDTPYSGGTFLLDIQFSMDYPLRPPKVLFTTLIYHPNINISGVISNSILNNDWLSYYNITTVLMSIYSMMIDPNPVESLVPEIAHVYIIDRARYNATAREWTRKYAM
ncbi:ubiquitin-conjugating enzyme E2-16 kDa [Rhizophagus clarus]|uniref:Ubiquitin-conjugating enzyme E2-16 kDa n=1 Tax=Rhizophagus clarus TaxID=94130 RepID=A0A8H3QJG6_9GLOM|nr:ubiquitin-conjugating enzyme E2-16 kDa [Rhizophagus clarus]